MPILKAWVQRPSGLIKSGRKPKHFKRVSTLIKVENVIYAECRKWAQYAECHYAKCHSSENLYLAHLRTLSENSLKTFLLWILFNTKKAL